MNHKLKKQLTIIEQTMINLTSLVDPIKDEKEFEHIINKKFRDKFINDKPECFLPLSIINKGIRPFFPICNRSGAQDQKLIDISRKLADKLLGDERFDQKQLKNVLIKLNLMRKQGSGLGPI